MCICLLIKSKYFPTSTIRNNERWKTSAFPSNSSSTQIRTTINQNSDYAHGNEINTCAYLLFLNTLTVFIEIGQLLCKMNRRVNFKEAIFLSTVKMKDAYVVIRFIFQFSVLRLVYHVFTYYYR